MALSFGHLAASTSLWYQSVASARAMFMALLRLGGVPPLIGFYAKLVVVAAIVDAYDVILASGIVLISILLVYVYVRLGHVGLCSATAGAPAARRATSRSVATLLLAPTAVVIVILCGGVCTGNFGFPGLIEFRHISTRLLV